MLTCLLGGPYVERCGAEELGLEIPISNPRGDALTHFHNKLSEIDRSGGNAHLLFYGASHVASDSFTGTLRRLLQERFGDAGHGFVVPAKPWRHYRHRDVNIDGTMTWWGDWIGKPNRRKDGLYGLAGVSISSSDPMDYASVTTTHTNPFGRRVSSFDLYYLEQPGGGGLDVRIDGQLVQRLDTSGLAPTPAYATYKVPDGPHRFEIRPTGDGEVRVFGVAMDRPDAPGITLDTCGVNGARASAHLIWDDELYRAHLQRRNPDLIVLAYGTNESGDDNDAIEKYEARFRKVLTKMRSALPNASCFLIGASDRPIREGRTFRNRPRTAQLNAVQARVGPEFGCGFFDLQAFMGGPLSMVDWVKADPAMAAPDHIHLNRAGYDRLAEVLFKALLQDYKPPAK